MDWLASGMQRSGGHAECACEGARGAQSAGGGAPETANPDNYRFSTFLKTSYPLTGPSRRNRDLALVEDGKVAGRAQINRASREAFAQLARHHGELVLTLIETRYPRKIQFAY
jgi:hypothetical protein